MQAVLLVLIVAAFLLLVVSLIRLGTASRRTKRPDIGPPTRRPPEAPRPSVTPRPVDLVPPVTEAPPTVVVEPAPAVVEPPVVESPPPVVEAPPVVVEPEPEAAPEPEPTTKPRLRDRLGRARATLSGFVGGVRSRPIDNTTWDDLEEALIRSDLGVSTTMAVIEDLRAAAKADKIKTADDLLDALKADLKSRLVGDRTLKTAESGPSVWLMVGVNGVGKTTTIGKLARREVNDGKKVMLAAGDTFRAAAGDQLQLWAERTGSEIVRGAEGADPGSVVFDAIEAGAARGAHLILADTAGRLHNKVNLMAELKKVHRIAERGPGTLTETLLVIDATTGNNGLAQAREFADAAGVTGVVLTKLDGTAKGGIALAIQAELGIPIKLVGIGEGADDLIDFDPDEFVDALFLSTNRNQARMRDRPTVMRARLFVIGPAVLALVLGACGTDLPKLPGQVAANGNAETKSAAGAPAADMMLRANIHYELAKGVTVDAKTGKAYQLGDGSKSATEKLAKALGVKGAVTTAPDGWTVGQTGKEVVTTTGGALYVAKGGGSFSMYWSYPLGSGNSSSGGGCSIPPSEPTAPDAAVPSDTAASPPVCEDATPTPPTTRVKPATAPTKAEAQQIATDALRSGGVDLHDPKVTVEPLDDFGFNVRFLPTFDGHSVEGFEAFVTVDSTKTITGANGYLGDAKSLGSYDLASLQRAVDRLNESMTARYATDGRETLDMGAPEATASSPAASANAASSAVAPAPDDAVTSEPAPDGGSVEPTVITLTKADVGLMLQGDSRGALFLVPAYLFTSDNGDMVTAAAAHDKYIEQPSTDTTGVTPTDGGSGGSTGSGSGGTGTSCQAILDTGPLQGWVCPDKAAVKAGESVHFKIYATHDSRSFSEGPCFDGVTVDYGDPDAAGEVACMACSENVADGPGKMSRERKHTYAKAGDFKAVFTIKSGPSCGATDARDSTATVTIPIKVT